MSKLVEMIKRHEGVKSKVYKCSQGFETIGVGRNISESGLGLSDDEIEYLLANDIARVKDELADTYFWFNGINEGTNPFLYVETPSSAAEAYLMILDNTALNFPLVGPFERLLSFSMTEQPPYLSRE